MEKNCNTVRAESISNSSKNLSTKFFNYILEKTEGLNLERYEPYIDLLRIFLPSIDQRICTLVKYFIYGGCSDNQECKPPFGNLDSWLEATDSFRRWVNSDVFCRSFIDSLLLSCRFERIGREINRMGFEIPRFDVDLCAAYDRLSSFSYWIVQLQKTFLKICPKSKQLCTKPSSDFTGHTNSSFDSSCSGCLESTSEEIKSGCSTCRGDKLRVSVTEVSPNDVDRTTKDNLDEQVQNFCSCLNNTTNRMIDDTLNNSCLCCTPRRNYVRYKLRRLKSKPRMFADREMLNNQCINSSMYRMQCSCSNVYEYNTDDDSSGISNYSKETYDGSYVTANSKKYETERSTRLIGAADQTIFPSNNEAFSFDYKNLVDNCSYCGTDIKEINKNSCNCIWQRENNMNIRRNFEKLNYSCSGIKNNQMHENSCVKESSSYNCLEKEFRDIGVMTEEIANNNNIILKNIETNTEHMEDSGEQIVYVNEISLCYCKNNTEHNSIGTNTENFKEAEGKLLADVSTNTGITRYKDNCTQIYLQKIEACACNKNEKDESKVGIKNVKVTEENKCNKATNTDVTINSSKSQSNVKIECIHEPLINKVIRNKSNISSENLTCNNDMLQASKKKDNEKLRQHEDNNENQSVLKYLINPKSCNKIHAETKTIKTNKNMGDNASIESLISLNCKKVCDDTTCLYKNILTEVTASLKEQVFKKIEESFNSEKIFHKSQSIDMSLSKSSCCSLTLEFIDPSICNENSLHDQNCYSPKARYIDCHCKCSKTCKFLQFLSHNFTNHTFENCKKNLRRIIKKIVEKGKKLNKLCKSQKISKYTCDCCELEYLLCSNAGSILDERCTCCYVKKSMTRLAGGFDANRRKKECTVDLSLVEFTRKTDACRNFNHDNDSKNQGRYTRKRDRTIGKIRHRIDRPKIRRTSTNYPDRNSKRSRRIKALASKWEKSYDIMEVSSSPIL